MIAFLGSLAMAGGDPTEISLLDVLDRNAWIVDATAHDVVQVEDPEFGSRCRAQLDIHEVWWGEPGSAPPTEVLWKLRGLDCPSQGGRKILALSLGSRPQWLATIRVAANPDGSAQVEGWGIHYSAAALNPAGELHDRRGPAKAPAYDELRSELRALVSRAVPQDRWQAGKPRGLDLTTVRVASPWVVEGTVRHAGALAGPHGDLLMVHDVEVTRSLRASGKATRLVWLEYPYHTAEECPLVDHTVTVLLQHFYPTEIPAALRQIRSGIPVAEAHLAIVSGADGAAQLYTQGKIVGEALGISGHHELTATTTLDNEGWIAELTEVDRAWTRDLSPEDWLSRPDGARPIRYQALIGQIDRWMPAAYTYPYEVERFTYDRLERRSARPIAPSASPGPQSPAASPPDPPP